MTVKNDQFEEGGRQKGSRAGYTGFAKYFDKEIDSATIPQNEFIVRLLFSFGCVEENLVNVKYSTIYYSALLRERTT